MNQLPQKNNLNNKNGMTVKSNRFQSKNIKILEGRERRNKRLLFGGAGLVLLSLIILWIFSQAKNPYQIWKGIGNSGPEASFVASLKGPTGELGDTGDIGSQGSSGSVAYTSWKNASVANANKSESDFLAEIKGETGSVGDGDYEVWRKSNLQNSRKSELDYRKSLKGEQGDTGITAYDVWRTSGLENEGATEAEYVEFLKGSKGSDGDTPYEIWKNANKGTTENTEYDFYKYIKGDQGDDGLTDYEIWQQLSPENADKTKEEYRDSIKGEKGDVGGETGFMVGEIRPFVNQINRDGWLLCDGSSFQMDQYPDLFRVLKRTVLPDYRGSVIAGMTGNNTIDTVDGKQSSILSETHLPDQTITLDFSHKHTIEAVTTVSGNHNHRFAKNIWTGGLAGSGSRFVKGSSNRKVTAETQAAGAHEHEVDMQIQDTQANLTTSFSLNPSNSQISIDNRQATTYYPFYIYAGKKK